MTPEPEVVVLADPSALAAEVVARTVATLAGAQKAYGRAAIAFTAGSIIEKVWAGLASSESARSLDWSRVDVFWADERFVPLDSTDRNDGPAQALLLGHEPFNAATHYRMPASDGPDGADLDAAAARYAATLAGARRASDSGAVPSFDAVLLGVGPDGHCASLFPGHPGARAEGAMVIPVRDSPKPPPLRVSFTFDALNTAREIWVVVSGADKADAVARALTGPPRTEVPSAGARGTDRTVWLLDFDAAGRLA